MPSNAIAVPDDVVQAMLDAVGDAFALPEAEARDILAGAMARGVKPVVAVAAAIHTRWKVEHEGGLNRPALYLRRLLERPAPERQVPRKALKEAREALGLWITQDEVRVRIVGSPPYAPLQVWEKAKQHLREQLDEETFDAWVRDTVLVAWEEGEFSIGVPDNATWEYFQEHLREQVLDALAQAAGASKEDIWVHFMVFKE